MLSATDLRNCRRWRDPRLTLFWPFWWESPVTGCPASHGVDSFDPHLPVQHRPASISNFKCRNFHWNVFDSVTCFWLAGRGEKLENIESASVCVELSYRAGLLLETCGWGASLSAAVGEGKASHRWQRPIVATADANRCQLLHIYTRSYCLAASCDIWLLSLLVEPDLQSTITGSFLHRNSSNCSNR